MNIPDMLAWLIIALCIGWFVFTVVVMVAVLEVARAALPYFQRENARHEMARIEHDRARGISTSPRY